MLVFVQIIELFYVEFYKVLFWDLFIFLLCINDLANISNKLKLLLFNDDTNVLYAG